MAAVACVAPVLAMLLVAALDAPMRESFVAGMPLLGRYLLVLVLPPLVLWGLARASGRRPALANLLLLANAIAFVAFAGIGQAAALLLLAAAATALGGSLLARDPLAAPDGVHAVLLGSALLVGTLGWLLPLPLHSPLAYLAVLGLLVVLARRRLATLAMEGARHWAHAVEAQPRVAALAVAVAGLAAVPAWLPSMNPDDNAVHLLLANQLLAEGASRLDVSSQIFSVAPWFNNVLHALLALLHGGEARQAVGLAWLLVGCVGAYRLAAALGARGAYPWWAVALYASQPLTAYFGMTLQVDGASAALLLHLLAACVDGARGDGKAGPSPWLVGALCGALVGLKLTNVVPVAIAGSWLAWHYASARAWRPLAILLAVAACVALSSYAYATLVTGNPLFPFFNGLLKSPYMPIENLSDPRWQTGVGLRSLWDLTMDSGRYMEAVSAGATGLSLLALGGAVLVALRRDRLGALVLFAVATGVVVFSQVQYLRYVFPAIVLLGTAGVVAVSRHAPRAGAVALLALVLAQCGLLRATSWILSLGVAERMLQEGPRALPEIERMFVPERVLLRRLQSRGADYCMLLAAPNSSYLALVPGRALTVTYYDPRMSVAARAARQDESGKLWAETLAQVGFSHVELRPVEGRALVGLMPALQSLGFVQVDSEGEAQLWARPGADPAACLAGTLVPRNEARRRFGTAD